MNMFHIAKIDNQMFLLVGAALDAEHLVSRYPSSELDSEELRFCLSIETSWLVENDIKKVIIL